MTRGWGLALLLLPLAPAPALRAAAPDAHVFIAEDGRTLGPPAFTGGGPIRVHVPAPPESTCLSAFRGVSVRYRYQRDVQKPQLLTLRDPEAGRIGSTDVHEIPAAEAGHTFVSFNVWHEWKKPIDTAAARDCVSDRRRLEKDVQPKADAAGQLKLQVRALAAQLAALQADAALLEQDAKAYQNVPGASAADQVAAIQARLGALRTQAASLQQAHDKAKASLQEAQTELAGAEAAIGADLGRFREATDQLSDYAADASRRPSAVALKLGGLPASSDMKAVYFDLSEFSAADVTPVGPMGPHPVVLFGERLFAGLLNVVPGSYPRPFALQVTAQAGAVVNTAPVRPVFDVKSVRAGEAAGEPARVPDAVTTDHTYQDLFLPVIGTFAPNDHAEVTIVTQRIGDNDQRTEVKVVEKSRFPQFRARYRYSFSTGVLRTGLRNPSFDKVKTVDDDPATKDVNEARYRVAEAPGEPRVFPMFAFSVYPRPIDVQGPVGLERFIPAPTIGFAFTDPADEVFLGFTHELVRNTQLVWGFHLGQVRERVLRNDVSEEGDATAPLTRDRRRRAFAVGLVFNMNVVKEIFK